MNDSNNDLFTAVEIEINHACNMSCSYCPNSVASRIEKGTMSMELYTQLIEQLSEIGFSGRISFDFYNEPLLCHDLEGKVSLLKKKLPEAGLHIYTNGSLLTVEKIHQLIELGVARFIVTKHEDVGENYIFDKVYNELDEKIKSFVDYRDWTELTLTNRGGSLKQIGTGPEALLPCYLPTHILVVTNKGNVLGCFEDFYQNHTFGNIMDDSILSIWQSPKFVKFRNDLRLGQRHRYKTCSGCNRVQVLPSEGKM